MGNFDRGGKKGGGFNKGGFGGKPDFQKKSWGNDNDRDRQMFSAKCSDCGKNCEVPFRPTNGKPVRCTDCFSASRENEFDGGRPSFNDRAPRREFNNDRPAFRPQLDRPAFAPANTGSSDDTKKTLAEISTKLDRLVTAIESMTSSTKSVASTKTAETVAPKTEAKAEGKKVAAKKVEVKKSPATVVAKVAPKAAEKKAAPAKKVAAKKAAPKKK